MTRVWCVIVLCSLVSCSPSAQSEKLRQEILSTDPRFAEVLEKHDQLADRITLLEREFAVKKTQVNGQIAQLRQELNQAKRQVDQKIRQLKGQLHAEQERVALTLSMAAEELKAKQHQRASLGRSISRLRKALTNGQRPWTEADRARMDRELAELLGEAQRLDRELEGLKAHLRLLKIKHSLLRL